MVFTGSNSARADPYHACRGKGAGELGGGGWSFPAALGSYCGQVSPFPSMQSLGGLSPASSSQLHPAAALEPEVGLERDQQKGLRGALQWQQVQPSPSKATTCSQAAHPQGFEHFQGCDSTTALGSLCQGLTTLFMRKFSLTSNLNLPRCCLSCFLTVVVLGISLLPHFGDATCGIRA